MQVVEIFEGIVQIKSVSREAGSRTKIAVQSIDEKIDPIGACVGPKGSRVKAVVDELGGEKIDIINYSEDPAEFISAALSPSKVEKVEINEEEKTALWKLRKEMSNSSILEVTDNVLEALKRTKTNEEFINNIK